MPPPEGLLVGPAGRALPPGGGRLPLPPLRLPAREPGPRRARRRGARQHPGRDAAQRDEDRQRALPLRTGRDRRPHDDADVRRARRRRVPGLRPSRAGPAALARRRRPLRERVLLHLTRRRGRHQRGGPDARLDRGAAAGRRRRRPVWFGTDPTNAIIAGRDHVRIGHGRMYADVSPVEGTFSGEAESTVDAHVTMRQGAEPERRPGRALTRRRDRPSAAASSRSVSTTQGAPKAPGARPEARAGEESPDFLSRQLITYLGNKRALLGPIESAVRSVGSAPAGRGCGSWTRSPAQASSRACSGATLAS